MTQKIKGEDLGPKWWGGSTASYVALGVKILLGLVATIVLVRIAGLYTGYLFFLDLLVTGSGMDVMRAKPIAFVLNMLSLALMPMALMYLLFGRGGWKLQMLAAAGGTVVFLWTYFVAEEVYFDRKTGESLRCYARTPAGIRFSSTCDYDPEFGIKYQKITPEIMLELKKSESDAIETTPVASVPPIRKTLDVLAEGSILSNEGKANLELWKWVNDQALRGNVQSEFVNADIKVPGTGMFFPDHIRYTMYVETVFVIRPYVLIALVLTPTDGDDVNVKIFRRMLN